MNHLLLASALFILAIPARAQLPTGGHDAPQNAVKPRETKPSDGNIPRGAIVGLGPFQIGITTTDSLAALTGNKPQPAGDNALRDYTTLGLPICKISNTELHNVKLIFFKNRLICLAADYAPLLQEMLEFRYGPAAYSYQRDTTGCSAKGTRTAIQVTTYSEMYAWHSDKASALLYRFGGYDEQCERTVKSGFLMYDSRQYEQYRELTNGVPGPIPAPSQADRRRHGGR